MATVQQGDINGVTFTLDEWEHNGAMQYMVTHGADQKVFPEDREGAFKYLDELLGNADVKPAEDPQTPQETAGGGAPAEAPTEPVGDDTVITAENAATVVTSDGTGHVGEIPADDSTAAPTAEATPEPTVAPEAVEAVPEATPEQPVPVEGPTQEVPAATEQQEVRPEESPEQA